MFFQNRLKKPVTEISPWPRVKNKNSTTYLFHQYLSRSTSVGYFLVCVRRTGWFLYNTSTCHVISINLEWSKASASLLCNALLVNLIWAPSCFRDLISPYVVKLLCWTTARECYSTKGLRKNQCTPFFFSSSSHHPGICTFKPAPFR